MLSESVITTEAESRAVKMHVYYTDLPRVFLQKTAYLFIQHKMRTDCASFQMQPKAFKLQFPISPSHLISLKPKPYDILTFFLVRLKREKSLNDACTSADELSGGLKKARRQALLFRFQGYLFPVLRWENERTLHLALYSHCNFNIFNSSRPDWGAEPQISDSDPVDFQSITIH